MRHFLILFCVLTIVLVFNRNCSDTKVLELLNKANIIEERGFSINEIRDFMVFCTKNECIYSLYISANSHDYYIDFVLNVSNGDVYLLNDRRLRRLYLFKFLEYNCQLKASHEEREYLVNKIDYRSFSIISGMNVYNLMPICRQTEENSNYKEIGLGDDVSYKLKSISISDSEIQNILDEYFQQPDFNF